MVNQRTILQIGFETFGEFMILVAAVYVGMALNLPRGDIRLIEIGIIITLLLFGGIVFRKLGDKFLLAVKEKRWREQLFRFKTD